MSNVSITEITLLTICHVDCSHYEFTTVAITLLDVEHLADFLRGSVPHRGSDAQETRNVE